MFSCEGISGDNKKSTQNLTLFTVLKILLALLWENIKKHGPTECFSLYFHQTIIRKKNGDESFSCLLLIGFCLC